MNYILIDDDPIINTVHKKIIQRADQEAAILSFVSSKNALQYLNSSADSTEHQIIFLDINMPELNGFEFLDAMIEKQVLKRHALDIYIVTSSLNIKDRMKANEYSILKGYLGKPMSVDTIKAILLSN
jgi:response regulator of citrate/malate metabolism